MANLMRVFILVILAVVGARSLAVAQSEVPHETWTPAYAMPDGTVAPPLELVDPGVADVNPLGTSLRRLPLDLRQPSSFERVYRVPGRPDLLMRIDGAVHAVFPRSVYVDSRFGAVPVVPENTLFFIGPPGEDFTWPPADLGPTMAPGAAAAVPHPPLDPRASLWEADRLVAATPHDPRVNLDASARRPPIDEILPAPPQPPITGWRTAQRPSTPPVADVDRLPRIVADRAYRGLRLRELLSNLSHAPPTVDAGG